MAWQSVGTLKGPQGAQGPQGEQGPQGIQGPPGEDGAGIEIAGSVANYAALPSDLGPDDAGDGYLVQADGKLYIWDGDSFPADGGGVEFRGPQGPQGIQGETGPQGPQGIQGETGATGPQGPAGADGARGSKWFHGAGAPQNVSGSAAGDYYLDTTDGTVYALS
jgi:hypothetical protein